MTRIGEMQSSDGYLYIQELKNKYYWIIEKHYTDFNDITEWEEISKDLYNSFLLFEINRQK